MKIKHSSTIVTLDEQTLQLSIQHDNQTWITQDKDPYFLYKDRTIAFKDAKTIVHKIKKDGVGISIQSSYQDFDVCTFSFMTSIQISYINEEITCSIIPIVDDAIDEVHWPLPFTFQSKRDDWYTIVPLQQGLLIPNTWAQDVHHVPFDGAFCSSSAYLPMYAQIKEGQGYLCINDTPWDSNYTLHHDASKHQTSIVAFWRSSLHTMSYKRSLRFQFFENCDYNTIAHAYRKDADQRGVVRTLKEKCVQHPSIDNLIGCSFLHKGIKTHVDPQSRFFDQEHPLRYESLCTFATRTKELKEWKQAGMKKLYLHLDGWGRYGYDQAHPEMLPPCQKAGGWDGLESLVHACQDLGYLIGLHDQYRDYYHSSKDYDQGNSIHNYDHTRPSHAYWAGGKQDYLCAKQALAFLARNYEQLLQRGIHPDCTYLDVFTCNDLDECFHPMHMMTRKECAQARNACFAWMLEHQILTSSEEVNEWSLPYQVFCHYAPYEYMMHSCKQARIGIPIPLFNLVYHDCIITPWPMDKCKDGDDFMLYALLNGGAPYLEKDAAYPNTDGVFEDEYEQLSKEEKMKRATIVASFHEIIAKEKMIKHTFVDGKLHHQQALYEDGSIIDIDLTTQSYHIIK